MSGQWGPLSIINIRHEFQASGEETNETLYNTFGVPIVIKDLTLDCNVFDDCPQGRVGVSNFVVQLLPGNKIRAMTVSLQSGMVWMPGDPLVVTLYGISGDMVIYLAGVRLN